MYLVSNGDVGILEISEAEKTALKEQTRLADPGAVSRVLEVFTDCEFQLRGASSKKILVEMSLMKAIDATRAVNVNDVLDKLKEMRNEGGDKEVKTPIAAPRNGQPTYRHLQQQ